MTTQSDIAELRENMDAKFERVYGELAELKSEQHGMAKDMGVMKMDIADLKVITRENAVEIAKVNGKIDRLETDVAAILAILKQQRPGGQP